MPKDERKIVEKSYKTIVPLEVGILKQKYFCSIFCQVHYPSKLECMDKKRKIILQKRKILNTKNIFHIPLIINQNYTVEKNIFHKTFYLSKIAELSKYIFNQYFPAQIFLFT